MKIPFSNTLMQKRFYSHAIVGQRSNNYSEAFLANHLFFIFRKSISKETTVDKESPGLFRLFCSTVALWIFHSYNTYIIFPIEYR